MDPSESKEALVIYIGPDSLLGLKAVQRGDELRVVRYGKTPHPEGFQGGFIGQLEKATAQIQHLIDEIEPDHHGDLGAYVVLCNAQIRQYQFTSSIYYRGEHRTITPHELRAVIQQTRTVATLPLSEHIIQVLPDSFMVNDHDRIQNPLGLDATRLGVHLNLFTMNYQDFKNISKAVEYCDVRVQSYFPSLFGIFEGILTPEEREQGALVLDIWEEMMQLILCKEGRVHGIKSMPFGTSVMTKRIAEEWGIQLSDAEKLKDQFGSLQFGGDFPDELMPLIERQGVKKNFIKRQEFQDAYIQFAYDWLAQLWSCADHFIAEAKMKYPHFIFTGGASQMDGLMEFSQKRFSRVARMGSPKKIDAPHELIVDPSAAAALSIFRRIQAHEKWNRNLEVHHNLLQKTLSSAKDWFLNYF